MNFWKISIQNSAYWNWLFSRIWILCTFTKCRITDIFRRSTAKRFRRNCWIWSATYEKWHHENCWRKYTLVITFTYKKSATVQQRFASVYGSKKATYTLVGAVAFLMLSFLTGLHSKRFHRNPPAEPFYVSFYTTNSNNVLDQTVVKITVTETVRPG